MKFRFFFVFGFIFSFIPLLILTSSSVVSRINPIYLSFGEVYSENSNEVYKTFTNYLKQNFSYEWSENYFNADVKTMLSKITKELSEMLPVKNVVFSKLNDEKNNKSFIFVSENSEGKKYISSVVLDDNLKILALEIKKE